MAFKTPSSRFFLLTAAFYLFGALAGFAESSSPAANSVVFADPRSTSLFDDGAPPMRATVRERPSSVFDNHGMVVAYYGNPNSTRMGILGEESIPEAAANLKALCREYVEAGAAGPVQPAFHLIYATVYPGGKVGLLPDRTVQAYIDYGLANGILVVLDHQLGTMPIAQAMGSMLHWLNYPNVHLAIDPEWRTPDPGTVIGQITAAEINEAEEMAQNYLVANNLPGKRMFIVHQFNAKMILHPSQVRTDFSHLDFVHHADGWGTMALKLDTYAFLAAMKNMPIKGFKLFFRKPWKVKGWDTPLLTPAQVLAINPRPLYISYQ
ncbi:MAG: hypothetical protein HKM06_09320 [Spirochaetales bacterium]|nr:hypothetical protein [Spirochaetales bacterium]